MARTYTTSSAYTAGTRDSRRSDDSYESRSTAPSSYQASSSPSHKVSYFKALRNQPKYYEDDVSPSTSLYPRSSVDTYSSRASTGEIDDMDEDDCVDDVAVPPLPIYHHEVTDANVRPSSPEAFAELFPSMDRLTIRHDELTSDGNMNLRVDAPGRRRRTIQLFHLRMYDLNKREFSLRRYCRDSGREVCNSKRKYTEPAPQRHPILQRSVSQAVKSMGRPQLKRTGTAGSMFSTRSRPGTGSSGPSVETDDDSIKTFSQPLGAGQKQRMRPVSTNAIKLEFSNYARVDVVRCGSKGSKRYEYQWWGHSYAWRRVTDKLTGVVAFHLFREGTSVPVAHIVPETRSPNQIAADEAAGGWVPPCHMWISDKSMIEAMTDVADVMVATGLMALVDDCIKERWGAKKAQRLRRFPLRSSTLDRYEYVGPGRSFVQQIFNHRRHSEHAASSSGPPPPPLRHGPVAAY